MAAHRMQHKLAPQSEMLPIEVEGAPGWRDPGGGAPPPSRPPRRWSRWARSPGLLRRAAAASFPLGVVGLSLYGAEYYHFHYHCGMMPAPPPTPAPADADAPGENATAAVMGAAVAGAGAGSKSKAKMKMSHPKEEGSPLKKFFRAFYAVAWGWWIAACAGAYLSPAVPSSRPGGVDGGGIVARAKSVADDEDPPAPSSPSRLRGRMPRVDRAWTWRCTVAGLVLLPSALVFLYGARKRWPRAVRYYGVAGAGADAPPPWTFQDWVKVLNYASAMPSGTAGMVSMGVYVFGTVARHCPLWSPHVALPPVASAENEKEATNNLLNDALRLHQWAGYATIVWFAIHSLAYSAMYGFDATVAAAEGAASEGDDASVSVTKVEYVRAFLGAVWDAIVPPAECRPLFGVGSAEAGLYDRDEASRRSLGEGRDVPSHPRSPCAKQYRNLNGLVSMLAFLALAATSLARVRRRSYRLFYLSHVATATVAVLTMIFHVRRVAMYLTPSLLCYLATTLPTLVQAAMCAALDRGVAIEDVWISTTGREGADDDERGGCAAFSFSVDGATDSRPPGHRPRSVKVCVPSISLVWHPFTVVESRTDRCAVAAGPGGGPLRCTILFGAVGPFTTALWGRLKEARRDEERAGAIATQGSSASVDAARTAEEVDDGPRAAAACGRGMPLVLVDGFYSGASDWLEAALRHDAAALVAGGTGVTPFLTFLPRLMEALAGPGRDRFEGGADDADFGLQDGAVGTLGRTSDPAPSLRDVAFVWCCRDEALIRHVVETYLLPLFSARRGRPPTSDRTAPSHRFRLMIHNTSRDPDDESPFDLFGDASATLPVGKNAEGRPMRPSRFYHRPSSSPAHAFFASLSFLSIAILGTAVVRRASDYMTEEPYMFKIRAYGVYAACLLCAIAGVATDVLWRRFGSNSPPKKRHRRKRYAALAGQDSGAKDQESDDCERGGIRFADDGENAHSEKARVRHEECHLPGVCAAQSLQSLRPGKFHSVHSCEYGTNFLLELGIWNGRPMFNTQGDGHMDPPSSTMETIVKAERPGVFYCGSRDLLVAVKSKIDGDRQKRNKSLAACKFHEESFEM